MLKLLRGVFIMKIRLLLPLFLSFSLISCQSNNPELITHIVDGDFVGKVLDNFKVFLKDADGNERLKEFPISSLVAGQAMAGRFADILLKYPDGSMAVVVPKIQIYDIKETGEKAEYIAVFAVNENEHNDLTEAVKEGVLDVRIYLDDMQEASEKTYISMGAVK